MLSFKRTGMILFVGAIFFISSNSFVIAESVRPPNDHPSNVNADTSLWYQDVLSWRAEKAKAKVILDLYDAGKKVEAKVLYDKLIAEKVREALIRDAPRPDGLPHPAPFGPGNGGSSGSSGGSHHSGGMSGGSGGSSHHSGGMSGGSSGSSGGSSSHENWYRMMEAIDNETQ
ncbi:MAG: hypothetical protein V8K32_02865 [Candidatus Electrothrix gigas]